MRSAGKRVRTSQNSFVQRTKEKHPYPQGSTGKGQSIYCSLLAQAWSREGCVVIT